MLRPLALVTLLVTAALAGCASPAGEVDKSETATPGLALACVAACKLALDSGGGEAFEPMIVVNPSDPLHLVAGYSEHTTDALGAVHRWNKAAVSKDGGATWKVVSIPGGPTAGPTHPLAKSTDMGDASVAILPDGVVLYSGLALNFLPGAMGAGGLTAYDLYVARSTDGGLTWPEVAVVARGRGAAIGVPVGFVPVAWSAHDKNWLTAGTDGTALVAWGNIQYPPTDQPQDIARVDLMFSASKDGGKTWSAPALVAKGKREYSGASPLVTANAWHIAFMNYGKPEMYVATSRDAGKTWTVAQAVADAAFGYPNLLAMPLDGRERLVLVYSRANESGESPAMVTSDDGATWSAPTDLDAGAGVRWIQVSAAASNGTLYVLAYHGPSGGPSEMRLLARRDNVTATLALDTGLAGSTGQRGHYVGVAALPDGAFATWVTGGRGKFDLAGASVRAR